MTLNAIEFSLNDGKRELVDKTVAAKLVSLSLRDREHEHITKICLSNKSYDEDAAAVIAEAILCMKNVTVADISDVIAGRPEEMALQVLTALSNSLIGRELISIDVSDNAMGEKGVNACRVLLEQQRATLQSLHMCNNGLSASAMELVRDIFVGSPPQVTCLRTLHFFNNMSGDGGAHALAEMLLNCPQLEDLRFSGTRAGRVGSVAVAKALEKCPAAQRGIFKKLDFADNTFGVEGGKSLGNMLKNQKGLEYLSLRDGSLEDEGIIAIAKSLIGLNQLRFLDLSANECTAAVSRTLSKALCTLTNLRYLGLEENDSFGSKGAIRLSLGLKNLIYLERLQLSQCSIGAKGALQIVRALEEAKNLLSLEMNGNIISEEGLFQVNEILSSLGKASILGEMDDNELEEEDVEESDSEYEDEDIDDLADALNKAVV